MLLSTFYNHILSASKERNSSISDIAKELMQSDIYGIEFLLKTYTDEHLPNIKLLREMGMFVNSIPAHTDIIHGGTKEYMDELIRKALAVDTKKIMLIPGFLAEGEDRDEMIDRSVPVVSYLCDKAEENGIVIGLEDYGDPTSPLYTSEGMLRYLKQIPKLTCTFDTGNFDYNGEDTYKAYKKLKKYINGHIHCKDHTREELDENSQLPFRELAIGDGYLPIRKILKKLFKSGFDGSVTIEVFGSRDTLDDIKKSAEFIKSIYMRYHR